jgi:hypothetical protein
MLKYFSIASIVFLGFGCAKYPTDSVTTEENDMIGTLYDVNADFSSYKTFAIVDSVLLIQREDGEPKPDTGVSRHSDRIISLLSQNMQARGYTRVHKDSAPDLGIDASLLNDENVGSYTYWGGYPGYWGWYGYSYWYPWPTTTYYRYEIGTLVINMVDFKNRDEIDKELNVIWHNVGAGLVGSSSSYNANRIDRAIEIMFEQSPYLTR